MKRFTLLAILMMAFSFVAKAEPTSYLTFNGTDQYVDIPTTDALKMSTSESLTFTFWAYTENVSSYPRIFSNRTSTSVKDDSFDNFVGSSGYALMFLSEDGSDPINAYIGGSSYTWVHVALVCDREAGTVQSYVNGVASTSGTLGADDKIDPDGSTVVGVGRSDAETVAYFLQGSIGNLRFYRNALTADQVSTDMAANSYAALSDDLKTACSAAYDLSNTLTSATLVDATGQGNNGTLINYDDQILAPERTITLVSSNTTMGTVSGGGTFDGQIYCIASANTGYAFLYWTDEQGAIVSTDATYIENSEGDKTLTANFAEACTITVTASENGTVSPSGELTVGKGASQTFTFTPNTAYTVGEVLLNGEDITADVVNNTYTIAEVTENTTLSVTFATTCNNVRSLPYYNYFNDEDEIACWTVLDNNGDGSSWYKQSASYPYYIATTVDADDWLISPPLAIEGGASLSFYHATGSTTLSESYEIYLMTSPDDTEGATLIGSNTVNVGTSWVYTSGYDLSAFAGQEGYLAFRCTSPANASRLYITYITITVSAYTITATSAGNGTATVNNASSASLYYGEEATFAATPNEGYAFARWEDADGNTVSTSNPYNVTLQSPLALNAIFVTEQERTVTVAVNNSERATATITSPATQASSITTNEDVTIVSAPKADNFYFINWTDATGAEISTSEEFTYSGVDNLTATANYEALYTVTTTNSSGGSITLSADGATVSSGSRVVEGTELTITLTPQSGKEISVFTINGEDKLADYTEGYSIVVYEVLTIAVEFKDPDSQILYSTTGAGYIEVYDDYDLLNNQIAYGDYVSNGVPLYIFVYPYADGVLQSITVNGDNSDYVSQIDEYGSAEFYATGNQVIEVAFTGTSTGVEDATAATAAVYGAEGAIVITAASTTATIYNVAGTQVASTQVAGTTVVKLQAGIYLVTLNGTSYKAIVK